MNSNPIVEEIHRIREELLAEHGGDLHSLVQSLQRRGKESLRSGRRAFTPPPSTPQDGPPVQTDESKKAG